jgi:hypothetical protein
LINWRFKGLEQAIKDGKTISFQQLTSMSETEFYGSASGYKLALRPGALSLLLPPGKRTAGEVLSRVRCQRERRPERVPHSQTHPQRRRHGALQEEVGEIYPGTAIAVKLANHQRMGARLVLVAMFAFRRLRNSIRSYVTRANL